MKPVEAVRQCQRNPDGFDAMANGQAAGLHALICLQKKTIGQLRRKNTDNGLHARVVRDNAPSWSPWRRPISQNLSASTTKTS
jgi:hypothetical protein